METSIPTYGPISEVIRGEQYENLSGIQFDYNLYIDCNFNSCNLSGTRFYNCFFFACRFINANLESSDICSSYFDRCDFGKANLIGAMIPPLHIPEVGSFKGFKKGYAGFGNFSRIPVLVEIEILKNSQRVRPLGNSKCRCEEARVVKINSLSRTSYFLPFGTNIDTCKNWNTKYPTMYRVGEIIKAPNYNPDIRIGCAGGIHFFLTRDEAINFIG